MRRRSLLVVAGLLCFAGAAAAQEATATSPLPGLAELAEGWNTLKPGGETSCAHGTEFEFYVRAGDPTRLLVYLYGGGACCDAEGCQPGSEIYTSAIQPQHHPDNVSGILDPAHPENPFASYSMVAVPVCTGDVHLGAHDTVYFLAVPGGEPRGFSIRHRGKTNVLAVLDWIFANFEGPSEIFVAGSSAGSLGMPFHASLLAQAFPRARVVGLGDDAGAYGAEVTAGADVSRWGAPGALRRHPGWEAFGERLGVEALYVTAGKSAPNLTLYQVDHAYDQVQRFFLERAGAEDPEVHRLQQVSRATIAAYLPDFRGFTIGGFRHTSLQVPFFYRYTEGGYRLRDWVADIAAGRPVPDVSCTACQRSGFMYDATDLKIAERAVELLSDPDAWNPRDDGGACAATPGRYSLRCAVFAAVRQVTGNLPGAYPFSWTVIYAADERLGGVHDARVAILYNNDPQTTAAGVLELLVEVRERIAEALSRSEAQRQP